MNTLFVASICSIVLVVALAGPASTGLIHPRRRHDRAGGGPARLAATGRVGVLVQRWRHRQIERARVSPAATAEWCDAIARSVRSGTSLRTALAQIVPADPALAHRSRPVRRAIERGTPIESAVATLGTGPTRRSNTSTAAPALALVSSVLATAGTVGGPAAASLDRLAAALRLRVADGQERAAHSAQARLSSHVLTVVPIGLLTLLALTDADVRVVLRSGLGITLLAVGLGLNLAGWWWMRRIISAGR